MINGSEMDESEYKKTISLIKALGSIVVLSSGLVMLVPSAENLRTAYILTESAKLATAENAKAGAEAILQRIDKLIELKSK